jgi:hypothetical protein
MLVEEVEVDGKRVERRTDQEFSGIGKPHDHRNSSSSFNFTILPSSKNLPLPLVCNGTLLGTGCFTTSPPFLSDLYLIFTPVSLDPSAPCPAQDIGKIYCP